MKRIVLTFGLISGAIFAVMMVVALPLSTSGVIDFDKAEIIGYTSMLLAFLLVFFGIRSYRENVSGGSITFGKAFKVGILITLISCVVYVAAWEILYFNFIPDFADKYAAHMIEKMREDGAPTAALEAERVKLAGFKELYNNVFINVGITFLEVFPIGLIVTLISAAILRRKTTPSTALSPA